jgi:hypothetical protein
MLSSSKLQIYETVSQVSQVSQSVDRVKLWTISDRQRVNAVMPHLYQTQFEATMLQEGYGKQP